MIANFPRRFDIRVRSGPAAVFLGANCLVFLGIWAQPPVSAVECMTIGRHMLGRAAASAAALRSAAQSPGIFAGGWL
jgi:hypothetical protein